MNKAAIRADLPDLIRFALGSGLRIGEITALGVWSPGETGDPPGVLPGTKVRQGWNASAYQPGGDQGRGPSFHPRDYSTLYRTELLTPEADHGNDHCERWRRDLL